MYLLPGTPRLAVLNPDGSKAKSLWLPMPDKGLPKIEWEQRKVATDLFDGGKAIRRLGFLPKLTLHWAIYLDQIQASFQEGVTVGAWGQVIGANDGQMPSMNDLLLILSAAPGSISVSPGPSAGGFIAQDWDIKAIGTNPLGQAEGVEIAFEGGTVMSTMVLEAF